uniref:Uncharacterized protein n=1 Tax=Panagrellus redivivus TaxID=6233 RepID=A0A7E5A280_PANRE
MSDSIPISPPSSAFPAYGIAILVFALILTLVIIGVVIYTFYKCNQASKQRTFVRRTTSGQTSTLGKASSSDIVVSFADVGKNHDPTIPSEQQRSRSQLNFAKCAHEDSSFRQQKYVSGGKSTELTLEGEDFVAQSPGMDIDALAAAMRNNVKKEGGSNDLLKKEGGSNDHLNVKKESGSNDLINGKKAGGSKDQTITTQTTITTPTTSTVN